MSRRGTTLIELLMTASIMIFVAYTGVALLRNTFQSWNKTTTEAQAKEAISRTIRKIEPTMRAALHIDESSTDRVLTLVMPKTSNGEIVVPLEGGDLISFYLSDMDGKEPGKGSVLWRSVNGRPDKKWALRNAHAVLDLGSGADGMTFEYPAEEEKNGVELQVKVHEGQNKNVIVRQGLGGGFLRNCPRAEEEGTEN